MAGKSTRDSCHLLTANYPLTLHMIPKAKETQSTRSVIWFSRIFRWTLGIVFLSAGYLYRKEEGSWMIILFGLVLFVTGFLRPKRCLDDNCNV